MRRGVTRPRPLCYRSLGADSEPWARVVGASTAEAMPTGARVYNILGRDDREADGVQLDQADRAAGGGQTGLYIASVMYQ